MADDAVLSVRGLVTHFFVAGGVVKAVDGLDLEIGRDEIVAIVGESGSGKSVTALSIMRLITEPGRILAGAVMHQGKDLLRLAPQQMQQVRGNSISMVFQNPHTSLHPLLRIGRQMAEAIRLRTSMSKADARREAITMLEHIGVENAAGVLERYPFEVSAGVSQRVMLAMALTSRPQLLIADEPTTNLDALAQVQFLRLVRQMRDELRMAVLLITHDFGVVSMLADRVVVMYAGKQMEAGEADAVLREPQHPYSAALLNSVRVLGAGQTRRLEQIPGEVPDVMLLPPGCSFRPRCRHAQPVCREAPPQVAVRPGHTARCWLHARPDAHAGT
jgi:oligopeptide/dipeptide ABC transporter ATP-binding protein